MSSVLKVRCYPGLLNQDVCALPGPVHVCERHIKNPPILINLFSHSISHVEVGSRVTFLCN